MILSVIIKMVSDHRVVVCLKRFSEILIKYKIDLAIISNTTEKNRENLKNIYKFEKGGK